MFWLIPVFAGLFGTAAAGTSVANSAMDGALFAPEINTYKAEISFETGVNERIINAIHSEANRYTNEIQVFNEQMNNISDLRKSFLVADSKATELAMQMLLERNPEFPMMPAPEAGKVQEVLVNGLAVIGVMQVSQGLFVGAAGTRFGVQIGKLTTDKINILRSLSQAGATRVMVAASSLSGISKVPVAFSPLLSVGSKVLAVGLQTGQGFAQAIRAGSAALGPLTALASGALIFFDVSFSKERAQQLRDYRDLIRRHNSELQVIQSQNARLFQQFYENRTALIKDEMQAFRYMAKITLALYGDELPSDFPSYLNSIEKIEQVSILEPYLVTDLLNFLKKYGENFVNRRSYFQISMIEYWKSQLTSCAIDARTLVELDPVLGAIGIDFAEYIYRTDFLSQAPPAACVFDLSKRQTIDGQTVQAADLEAGRIFQQAGHHWIYVDSAKRVHSYLEMSRDPWTVYLVSRTEPEKALRLDMWRRELIADSFGQEKLIDKVRAGYTFAVPTYEAVTPAPFEYDIDRPGLDYRQVDGLDIVECSKACAEDLVCRSFTWTPGANNRCHLKDGQPQPEGRTGSSFRSGIKI